MLVCAASASVVCELFDFVIASDKAQLYVTSPFVTEKTDKKAGSLENASKAGLIDVSCKEDELASKVRDIVTLLPQEAGVFDAVNNGDDINRATPEVEALLGKKMKEIVDAVADNGQVVYLKEEYAPEMITALASIGGFTCGIVATDPKVKDGAVTPDGAEKAAAFINVCDSLLIPVVTLIDSVGTEPSAENENKGYSASLSKLAYAYAAVDTDLITVVTGKAYGVAGVVLGSKSLGADVVYATENAVISAMAPDAAVSFLYGKEISESEDAVKARKEKLALWNEENASPVEAARAGEVDDIISADELRMRICATLEMLNS